MKASPRRLLLLSALFTAGVTGVLYGQNPVPASPRSSLPRSPSASANAPVAEPIIPTDTAPRTAAPAQSGQGVTAAGGDYVLALSDTVEMTVFHEPDLSTQTKIGSDGSAQFPLIGEIKIAGMPMRDARELIRRKYNSDYLVDPQVYLNVVSYAGRKFTILGQVNKPGTYDFPPGERLTLMEAVGVAGGFTRLADRGEVVIKRSFGGPEQTLKINTKKPAAKDGKAVQLAAGDVINVGESWF